MSPRPRRGVKETGSPFFSFPRSVYRAPSRFPSYYNKRALFLGPLLYVPSHKFHTPPPQRVSWGKVDGVGKEVRAGKGRKKVVFLVLSLQLLSCSIDLFFEKKISNFSILTTVLATGTLPTTCSIVVELVSFLPKKNSMNLPMVLKMTADNPRPYIEERKI